MFFSPYNTAVLTQLGSCSPLKMSWHGTMNFKSNIHIHKIILKCAALNRWLLHFFFVATFVRKTCFCNNVLGCTICSSQKILNPLSVFSWHFWISVCVHNAKSIKNNCTVGVFGKKHMKLQCLYSPRLIFSAKRYFISQKPLVAKHD